LLWAIGSITFRATMGGSGAIAGSCAKFNDWGKYGFLQLVWNANSTRIVVVPGVPIRRPSGSSIRAGNRRRHK